LPGAVLNPYAILLSVAALAIACAIPSASDSCRCRSSAMSIAFSFGIPMAFAAIRDELPGNAGRVRRERCYTFAYDTEYAMVDRDDDRAVGIHTSRSRSAATT